MEQRRVAGRAIRTYSASHVRDFAWAAGHLDVLTTHAAGARVRVWHRRGLVPGVRADDMRVVAHDSIATYSAAFGAYPIVRSTWC